MTVRRTDLDDTRWVPFLGTSKTPASCSAGTPRGERAMTVGCAADGRGMTTWGHRRTTRDDAPKPERDRDDDPKRPGWGAWRCDRIPAVGGGVRLFALSMVLAWERPEYASDGKSCQPGPCWRPFPLCSRRP